jgi:hypothetical protein
MNSSTADVAFVLDELNAAPSTISGRDWTKPVIPMLRLHLKVQRHTKGTTQPELIDLPPIHVDPAMAAALPAALMSAIQAHLPHAYRECCEHVASALPGGGSTPARQH